MYEFTVSNGYEIIRTLKDPNSLLLQDLHANKLYVRHGGQLFFLTHNHCIELESNIPLKDFDSTLEVSSVLKGLSPKEVEFILSCTHPKIEPVVTKPETNNMHRENENSSSSSLHFDSLLPGSVNRSVTTQGLNFFSASTVSDATIATDSHQATTPLTSNR